jgi:soluble epoxide hydrolase / lipid-phosphate phosphatase
MTSDVRHRLVESNGIRMHLAEQGNGFPVVMLHGFPELWFSWRHQLPALAAAGYRAIAPDQRGYGESDKPEEVESYRVTNLVADIIGLLDALDLERAAVVGHDWGGPVAWQLALRHPERIVAVAVLNTPYRPPGPLPPTQAYSSQPGPFQYQLYFQAPGVAERELSADVRHALAIIFRGVQDDPAKDSLAVFSRAENGVLGNQAAAPTLLTPEELDVYEEAFMRGGFRGPLNWYRNIDRNWEENRALPSHTIHVPALMVTAENDSVLLPAFADGMEQWLPQLRRANIKRCSHWTQQERPDEVNRLLIEFFGDTVRLG